MSLTWGTPRPESPLRPATPTTADLTPATDGSTTKGPSPLIAGEGPSRSARDRIRTYDLLRSGELRAIRVGGRNQWRVCEAELEAYIERAYAATAEELRISATPRASS
ncbi:helix-turn-helix domain-containing protein [Helcobacillus massiliensis]|uniref:helix-turn-helix domain-containing protein n=1 Tax=Helcobacillus massiliensis TaxID=521392 RepID=UPI0016143444